MISDEMKKILTVTILASIALNAFAQKKAPTEIACPLMKDHKANIKEATGKKLFSDYKGRRYYFCCAGCKPSFDKNPAKYAPKSASVPTPKKA